MKVRHTDGDQNLLKAAQAVREDPSPEKFTMRMYARSCGTPACVLGCYTLRPDLQSEFSLCGYKIFVKKRGSLVHFEDPAILAHFEITRKEAFELFASDGCGRALTPAEAADYIEAFVAARVAART